MMGTIKGKIKRTEILKISHGRPYEHGEPLLFDKIGEPVFPGDMVQFSVKGEIYQRTGYVSNIQGLSIGVFNNVLNKWEFYLIDLDDKLKE